jgi:hypothetical protein
MTWDAWEREHEYDDDARPTFNEYRRDVLGEVDEEVDVVAAPFDTVCECGEPKRPDDEKCDDCWERDAE